MRPVESPPERSPGAVHGHGGGPRVDGAVAVVDAAHAVVVLVVLAQQLHLLRGHAARLVALAAQDQVRTNAISEIRKS